MNTRGKVARRDLSKTAGLGAAWVFSGGFLKLPGAKATLPGQWSETLEFAEDTWPEDLVAVHAVHLPPLENEEFGRILIVGLDTNDLQATQGYLFNTDSSVAFNKRWEHADGTSDLSPDPQLYFDGGNFFCSGHDHLFDGRPFFAGGDAFPASSNEDKGIKTTAIFDLDYARQDSENNAWRQQPDMEFARWYPTVTVFGNVYVTAGLIRSPEEEPEEHADIPETINWAEQNPAWGQVDAWIERDVKRGNWDPYPFMFVIWDKHDVWPWFKMISAGKRRRDDDPSNGTKSWLLDMNVQAPDHGWYVRDSNASVVQGSGAVLWIPGTAGEDFPTGWILKTGGVGSPPGPTTLKTTWLNLDAVQGDPPLGHWKLIGDGPITYPEAPPFLTYNRINHNMVFLADGTVVCIGGADVPEGSETGPNDAVLETEAFNPFFPNSSWDEWEPSPIERMYHSIALLLPDGSVLVAGGGHNENHNYHYPSGNIFYPPYLLGNGSRPEIASVSNGGIIYYNSYFQVETPDAEDIEMVSLVKLGSTTHGFDMGQRFVNVDYTVDEDVLLCTAPKNAGIAPSGHYMLFIIREGTRMPSIAKYVQVLHPQW